MSIILKAYADSGAHMSPEVWREREREREAITIEPN
jgi:hypothetical protein